MYHVSMDDMEMNFKVMDLSSNFLLKIGSDYMFGNDFEA